MRDVSVIIPVHNREALIRRAIHSVLGQTYRDFEVIVVDDGSTDNTASVAASMAEQDKRIRLLRHVSNRGAQAARNTGIRNATGKWLAFLDSDDQWYPESLRVRLEMAAKNSLHVVHSECDVVSSESSESRRFGVPPMQGRIYKDLLRSPGPMFQGLIVSKEVFNRIGFLDESLASYQEWDTAIRIAKRYAFGFIADPTFLYDCRPANTISKNLLRSAQGYEQIFTKHRLPIIRILGPKALVRHYEIVGNLYRAANDNDNAQRCSMSAFLCWPFRPRTIFRGFQRLLQPRP